jgi:hypothetical protein
MKFALLLCLAASACAEELPSPSPLESFFRTVDYRSRITETPPPDTFAPPTIQAALGFTDSEMQSLNSIASAFVNRASALRAPTSEMIFQARLELADTGKESETLKQYIKQMNAEVDEALAKAAGQLRAGGATGCWVARCSVARR